MTLWSRLAGAQDDERGDQGRQKHRRGVELRVRAHTSYLSQAPQAVPV